MPPAAAVVLPIAFCAFGEPPDFLLALAELRYIDNLAFGLIAVVMLSDSECNAISYSSVILLILFITVECEQKTIYLLFTVADIA